MLIMVSIGMMIVIVSGGIDLSVGSVMGLSGMIAALVLRDHRGMPIAALFLIAMGVGLLCGTITGFVVGKAPDLCRSSERWAPATSCGASSTCSAKESG